jgi:hypothetical protein
LVIFSHAIFGHVSIGYPTVKFFKDAKQPAIDYNGRRSTDSVCRFCARLIGRSDLFQ